MTEDLDVRCLPYMPLGIERLKKSKSWLRCKRQPELGFYMVNLWMRAWHEVPAGSIEDDDDVLADAAMCSPDTWESVKDAVLEGWERRDGRVFNSTVTEVATEASAKLRKNKNRTSAAREARQQGSDSTVTEIATEAPTDQSHGLSRASERTVTDIVTSPEGKGREEKGKWKDRGAAAPDDLAFAGRVIRLNQSDFDRWRKVYHAIPDMTAELTKADAYFVENPPKNGKWFFPASRWLEREHKSLLGRQDHDAEREKREAEIYESLR